MLLLACLALAAAGDPAVAISLFPTDLALGRGEALTEERLVKAIHERLAPAGVTIAAADAPTPSPPWRLFVRARGDALVLQLFDPEGRGRIDRSVRYLNRSAHDVTHIIALALAEAMTLRLEPEPEPPPEEMEPPAIDTPPPASTPDSRGELLLQGCSALSWPGRAGLGGGGLGGAWGRDGLGVSGDVCLWSPRRAAGDGYALTAQYATLKVGVRLSRRVGSLVLAATAGPGLRLIWADATGVRAAPGRRWYANATLSGAGSAAFWLSDRWALHLEASATLYYPHQGFRAAGETILDTGVWALGGNAGVVFAL